MKSIIYCLLLILLSMQIHAQQKIEGHVYDQNDKALDAAIVYLAAYDVFTLTDTSGFFTFNVRDNPIKKGSVIISRIGFEPDTFYIAEAGHYDYNLRENTEITAVTIKGRKAGTFVSRDVAKIEVITAEELTKAACCDLAGCFNTQGSVQVNTTNQLTNAKELRLLGVSGVYNQILMEGLPLYIGNSLTYGISQLSGTMISSIMVAKGTTSVLQGYDAISGQINVLLKKYDQMEPFLFNAYFNNFGEKQFNLNFKSQAGPIKISNALHFALPGMRMDIEGDGFLNMPLTGRVSLYQTWEIGSSEKNGYASFSGLMYTQEERTGGQFGYQPAIHRGSSEVYGQNVRIIQPSVFSKHYYRFNSKHGVGLYSSYQHHTQDSWMGLLHYQSTMQHLWTNLQWETRYGQANLLKGGISYRYFSSHEEIDIAEVDTVRNYGGIYHKMENVPGVYLENVLEAFEQKLTLITGARLDKHFTHGWFFTPRLLMKYDFAHGWTYRISGGKGYRTINTFADYPQIIASGRNFSALPTDPELAYTFGTSLNHTAPWKKWTIDWGIDLYSTLLQNQVFPDFDIQPTFILLQNTRNATRAYNAQADIKASYNEWLELKASYSFLDVTENEGNNSRILPFIQRHRFSGAASLRPSNFPFYLDMNVHVNGSQRLPDPSNLPEQYKYDEFTPVYTILSAQITWKGKQVDIYGGCENIGGFFQRFPLRAFDDPFGPYFDVTTAWGPTRGREWYMGLRYHIREKTKS